MSKPGAEGATLDPGLRALVRLSAALASRPAGELEPFLVEVARDADPREVEEALLQSHLFLGYPAALNALAGWRRVSGTPAPSELEEHRPGVWIERGAATCRRVYGSAYEDLRRNVRKLSAEMDRWMVVEGYGRVLGRPGLELGRRECCIVAILAVSGVPRQLHSHLRGALRCGVPAPEVGAVLELALEEAGEEAAESARATWDLVRTSRGDQ